MERIADPLFALDREWRFTYLNPGAEGVLQRSAGDLLGRVIWDALPDAVGTRAYEAYHQAMQHGVPIRFEECHASLDACFSVAAYPSADGLSVVFQDATESKQAQAEVSSRASVDILERERTEGALRAGEERFRAALLAVSDIVWTNDAAGRMVGEQPGWAAFTGQSEKEYQGYGWSGAVHPDDVQPTVHAWEHAVESRSTFEFEHRVRRRDGVYRLFAIRAVPVLNEDGTVREWVGVHRDVTDGHAAEQALRRTLALLHGVVEGTSDVVAAKDCAGRYLLVNAATARVFGRRPEEILGRTDLELLPEPVALGLMELDREVRETGMARVEEEQVPILGDTHTFLSTKAPLRDTSGAVIGVTVLARDITLRKLAEEEVARARAVAEELAAQLQDQAMELESQASEAEMLTEELQAANEQLVTAIDEAEAARLQAEEANQSKSAFLAAMSHELRTPLNAIGGYVNLIELGIRGPVTQEQDADLQRIKRAQQHLLGLINDVLNFAKLEAGRVEFQFEAVPLEEALTQVEEWIAPQAAARGIRYRRRAGDPAVRVYADREKLQQVVLNLLSNAVKFTEPGGEVFVAWRATDRAVEIHVKDTGIGIAPDRLASVFEPFVQVNVDPGRKNEGTGLGLAISRELARSMGGDLFAQSIPGRGSVFTLRVPTSGSAVDGAAEPRLVHAASWWPGPHEVPGLAEVGHLLVKDADRLVARLGDRLRDDPALPEAARLDRAHLEDHIATFLVEIGQALVVLDEGGSEPALMRDGSEIQRLVAELHGEQRVRLGWTWAQVHMEYDFLRREIDLLVLHEAAERTDADLGTALAVLHRLIDRAESISRRAFEPA